MEEYCLWNIYSPAIFLSFPVLFYVTGSVPHCFWVETHNWQGIKSKSCLQKFYTFVFLKSQPQRNKNWFERRKRKRELFLKLKKGQLLTPKNVRETGLRVLDLGRPRPIPWDSLDSAQETYEDLKGLFFKIFFSKLTILQ